MLAELTAHTPSGDKREARWPELTLSSRLMGVPEASPPQVMAKG